MTRQVILFIGFVILFVFAGICLPASAANSTAITSAGVTGFVAPVTGATPITASSLTSGAPTQYTVSSLAWSGSPSTYAASTPYTATVVLTSASGYTFSTALTPTVNTGTPAVGTVAGSGTGNTLTFTVTFPATAAATPTAITSAGVTGFVAPVTGATPITVSSLTPGSGQYTVSSLAWSGSPSTYAASTPYTATVTLTAAAGYTFSTALTPTVNTGTPAAGTVAGSGTGNTLTFKVTFPATAAATPTAITSAGVTGFVAPVTGATPITVSSLTPGSGQYTVSSLAWSGSPSTY